MYHRSQTRHSAAVGLAVLCLATATAAAADSAEETWLKQAGLAISNDGLSTFLKSQTSRQPADIARLIRQLGSDSFDEREDACRSLVTLGSAAVPALKEAARSTDLEVRQRAASCLDAISKGQRENWADMSCLAVRLLARRAPADGVETLLTFLPNAQPGQMEEEVWYALDSLAARGDKLPAALLAALGSANVRQRGLAACIVGRRGDAEQKPAVRKLLEDREAMVRLRAAQGLLAGGDAAGVTALIALLDQEAVELGWQAEELLHWLAGETAPVVVLGAGDTESRRRCRAAWEAWRNDHPDWADPAKAMQSPRRPGLMLLCVQTGDNGEAGQVYLTGCDGRPRWVLSGLSRVHDAFLLAGPRVLTAESQTKNVHVREHNLAGKCVAEHEPNLEDHAVACLQLANGNLLLAGTRQLVERSPDRRVVRERHHIHHTIRDLARRGDGKATLINPVSPDGSGVAVWALDYFNPELDRRLFSLGRGVNHFNQARVEPLANGNYLVYGPCLEQLLEVDEQGKTVWQARTGALIQALPLPGGNVLVASQDRLQEIDRGGQTVWQAFPEGEVQRARVCLGLVRFGFRPSTVEVGISAEHLTVLWKQGGPGARRRLLEHLQVLVHLPSNVLDLLKEALTDIDGKTRRLAARVVVRLGPRAKSAVPCLLDCLNVDKDLARAFPEISVYALALTNIGPGAIPALRQVLSDDPQPRVRANAAVILAALWDEDESIGNTLLEHMNDKEPVVRCAVMEGFTGARRKMPGLKEAALKCAKDDNQDLHFAFRLMMSETGLLTDLTLLQMRDLLSSPPYQGRYGFYLRGLMAEKDRAALADLLRYLKDRNHLENRLAAATALGGLRRHARTVVPALIEMLQEPPSRNAQADSRKRGIAAAALARLAPQSDEAVKAVVEYVKSGADSNLQLQRDLLHDMHGLGAAGKAAVPYLLECLQDDGTLAGNAVLTLTGIGAEAVPGLLEVLEKGSIEAKLRALAVLADVGPPARPATAALINFLDSPERSLRDAAARALGSIGPAAKEAIPTLVRLAQMRTDPKLIEPLARIGTEDRRVATALLEMLKDRGNPAEWRAAAARGIGQLGPGAREAVPLLIDLAQTADTGRRNSLAAPPLNSDGRLDESRLLEFAPDLRGGALLSLRRLGPAATEAAPMLTRLCGSRTTDLFERLAAAEALERMGPNTAETVQGLIAVLQDELTPTAVRVAVIRALDTGGRLAQPAVPVLEKEVELGVRPVRLVARAALARLRR